jgi:hypothetical protein
MYLKEALNSIERGQSILSQLLDFSNVLTSTRDSITQQYETLVEYTSGLRNGDIIYVENWRVNFQVHLL